MPFTVPEWLELKHAPAGFEIFLDYVAFEITKANKLYGHFQQPLP